MTHSSRFHAVVKKLRSLENPANAAGMARYGIVSKNVLGISAPVLKSAAKEIGKDHEFALELWSTGIYEARILAALIDDELQTSPEQMDKWAHDFDNWAICDGCCIHLFRKTPYAWEKAKLWHRSGEEFVRRAGFTLMATLAVHDKTADDEEFKKLLPAIRGASTDERNGVKKAVNWALRQIGKRNLSLNKLSIQTAKEIGSIDSPSARWIAGDALRELTGKAVQNRLKNKPSRRNPA